MRPELRHVADATCETAALMYWVASRAAPLVNSAPCAAQMSLQALALIAAGRVDRVGDQAARRFETITHRAITRRGVDVHDEPPAAA
jgi:hypothetical protein